MGKIVLKIYNLVLYLDKLGIPLLPNLINKIFIRLLFGFQIGIGAKIGKNVNFGYGGLGVVIHHRCIVGDNVEIGTGVTLGGTSKKKEVPIIGENTMLSTGSKIIGSVKIGKNCVIGANAVVVNDIPDNCVAVGIPAKIIKTNINILDYRDIS